MAISLRPVQASDEAFLFELYCSTREDEVAAWGWSDAQRDAFLQMQFRAQRQHYRGLAAPVSQSIVCRDLQPIGWMAVITEQDCVHLAEIALLPDERNHGIGTALISGVLGEARSRGAPVQLRVLRNNRACRLYERLGFLIMADNGIHLSMEWRPVAG
jgi:GNAT superfamily N-acetyltransferase